MSSLNGSVTASPSPAPGALPLSLDDAVRRGLEHNLSVVLAGQNRQAAAGERLKAINFLLPDVSWQAQRSHNQIDLAAKGFRPSLFGSFPSNVIPPAAIPAIPDVVTANVVSVQANLHQTLFNLNAIDLYRAAKQEIQAVDFSYRSLQGAVIQTVIDSYLEALADDSKIFDARELLATDAEILRQAKLQREAGAGTRLDELRAQVEYRRQQQALIAAENAFSKAKIVLNREIGLPADQPIRLTDATPYAPLAVMPLDEALRLAFRNRQQYLRLKSKLRSAQLQSDAARHERLPTLSFHGNYGLTGTVGGVYHGTFIAAGTLSIPLFRHAGLRGDRDVAHAAVNAAEARLANFKTEIEAQIRDSMLDVATSKRLVNVARSNVNLAHATLDDARLRFQNGISDNLPVIQAQSTLASAQTQLVDSLFRYNVAKVALARSVGVIESQYRAYLGTAVPTAGSTSSE
jgi:outer membrane protein TolC